MKDNGFLYVATGKSYLDEAIKSAKSILDINPQARISLITDKEFECKIFEQVIVVGVESITEKSWKANLIFKILGISNSPYDNTIFLDTDTFVIKPIDDLFNLLEYFDLLNCLDYYDKSLIGGVRDDLKSYTPYNTGVLAYKRNNHTSKLFVDWKKKYEENIDTYWSDQPAFMEALMLNQVKTYTLPTNYNFRFLNNVGFLEKEPVKIIHGRGSDSDLRIIAERVNRTLSNRVWVASRRRVYSWKSNQLDLSIRKIYSFLPEWLKSIIRN